MATMFWGLGQVRGSNAMVCLVVMRWVLIAFICCFSITAEAKELRLGVGRTAATDATYEVGLLKIALDHAPGDHKTIIVPTDDAQARRLRMLASSNPPFDVISSGYAPDRENKLKMVRVPLSRGLLGYRVLIVKRKNLERLHAFNSLDDFRRQVTLGSGSTWPDTPILRSAGLSVITGEKPQLWEMLARDRFLAYPRGLKEVMYDLEQQRKAKPHADFVLDNRFAISYKFDLFFYVSPEAPENASLIETGLLLAYESGAFMDYFNNHPTIKPALANAAAHKRTVLKIDNPLLSETVRKIPDHHWHDLVTP